MKACVLHGIGDLKYEDFQTPKPQKGKVLIKIKASGICGSDIPRIFTKGTYSFPMIPGHEFAGEITELGAGVDEKLLGKKAAVFPLLPCFICDACSIGEYAQCIDYNYYGSRCNGGFAEYISVPLWNLILAPDSLTYEEIAMTEPSAVAIHALRQAQIEIGDNVVIFGAGPIGLMLGQWAKAWGADHVILLDIDNDKIHFAVKQGFKHAYNSTECDPVEKVMKLTKEKGADVAVEGAGVSQALEGCLNCTRPFGRVVAMGNPAGDMILSQKSYWQLLRKQLKLFGTWNSSFVSIPKNDWVLALGAMETGKIDVRNLITHKVSLDKANDVLHMMKDRIGFYNKILFIMEDWK